MTWLNRISYISLAVAIGGILFLLWQKANVEGQLSTANVKLHEASIVHDADVATHKADVATINRITSMNTANDKIVTDFVAKLATIEGHFSSLGNQIEQLRRQDATVNQYLSQPVPPALRSLLNGGVCEHPKATGTGTYTCS